jgi:hypothetical protein
VSDLPSPTPDFEWDEAKAASNAIKHGVRSMTKTTVPTEQAADVPEQDQAEVRQLRAEVERLREALEGVLIILGNPEGYCERDQTEVAHAVAEAERALGRRR